MVFGFIFVGGCSSGCWWGCEEFKWDGERKLICNDLFINRWCKEFLERCNIWFNFFWWLGGGWYCY